MADEYVDSEYMPKSPSSTDPQTVPATKSILAPNPFREASIAAGLGPNGQPLEDPGAAQALASPKAGEIETIPAGGGVNLSSVHLPAGGLGGPQSVSSPDPSKFGGAIPVPSPVLVNTKNNSPGKVEIGPAPDPELSTPITPGFTGAPGGVSGTTPASPDVAKMVQTVSKSTGKPIGQILMGLGHALAAGMQKTGQLETHSGVPTMSDVEQGQQYQAKQAELNRQQQLTAMQADAGYQQKLAQINNDAASGRINTQEAATAKLQAQSEWLNEQYFKNILPGNIQIAQASKFGAGGPTAATVIH
jgi:hypothetical protein